MTSKTAAQVGWVMVAAVVIAVDTYVMIHGDRTMSGVYRDTFRRHPLLIGGATVYLVTHLTGHCPRRFDVLARLR